MRLLSIFAAAVLSLTAVRPAPAKPLVVTTHTVLSDLVHEIAGDAVEIVGLLPVNIDPHNFDPRPADVRTVSKADLVVINGLGLEPWATKLIAGSGYTGRVVTATDGLSPLLPLAETEAADSGPSGQAAPMDPHAWQDPRNVRHYVEVITDALAKILPDQAVRFRARAAKYDIVLDELDASARRELATIPAERRKLVTSHDALQYLGHAYGLQIIPVAGSQPGQEPSAHQLAMLITTIRREHVPAVFFEATTGPKLVQLVAREAGVKVVRELYTDSLGPPGSPGATYAGMFRHNLATLVGALK